ncbi:MAG: PIG-L deacetylase family protein, partial [Halofilum sp. (in: g-proteobacteria)]
PPRRVLCLGAHSDDIEIGCGGAVLALTERIPNLQVHWVVFSARDERAAEAERSATRFLSRTDDRRVVVESFRDGYFPYDGAALKDCFETVASRIDPDVIFTHYRNDRHQDHRTVAELTWNTFRNHFVLEYEIPKYDGELGNPNMYWPLSGAQRASKTQILLDCFDTQAQRSWFSRETFDAMMRLRGIECRAESGYAEAFHCHKAVVG